MLFLQPLFQSLRFTLLLALLSLYISMTSGARKPNCETNLHEQGRRVHHQPSMLPVNNYLVPPKQCSCWTFSHIYHQHDLIGCYLIRKWGNYPLQDNIFKRKIKSKMVCPLHKIEETDYLHHHIMSSSGGQRTNLVRDSAPVTCLTFRKTGNLSWPYTLFETELKRQLLFRRPFREQQNEIVGPSNANNQT